MEKVKVTKEQAGAIEYFRKTFVDNKATSMSNEKLAKALHHGYEIEPEFKKGDYVMVKWKNRQKEEFYQVVSIDPWGSFQIETLDGSPNSSGHENTRHATPEEIKKEKERRWWAKHGREVKEVRNGDIIYSYSTGVTFVRNENNRHVTNFDGFRVVCFAENRLDLSN
ncbi:hypothetical protein [Oceanobacillus kimchii]|uniref:hypothetical protein n=1 Tax=Oceanobacillus kimchii TaxID=746691 RepID=UPI00232DB9A2|nr:hypothetical protein [Oceanobacillus kimchii]